MNPLPHPLVVDGQFQVGRYDRPFPRLNCLDADPRSRVGYRLRRLRVKEWQAFQFCDGRFFGVVALIDAKFLSLVQAKVYDAQTQKKHLFERKVLPTSFAAPHQILDSTMQWRGRDGWMRFETRFAEDRASVTFDLPATRGGERLTASFDIDYRNVEPVVVCLPFDDRRAMYSQKGVARASGTFAVGGTERALDPNTAFALLDDHRGYYPRPMVWDWLTSGGHIDGKLWGLNLTANQCLRPDQYNENTLWFDGKAHGLPPIEFERTGFDKKDVWTVRDRSGAVDVRFEIELPGSVPLNLGLFESRYQGPFGRVSGHVACPDGPAIDLDGALAMGERFWLKA